MLCARFARVFWFATAVAGLSLLSRAASAVQWDFRQVYCGKQHMGTMFVNKDAYQSFKTTVGQKGKPVSKENWLGGVRMQAGFAPIPDCKCTLHYLQSVKTTSDSFRWIKDPSVPLPSPYLDAPPGGTKVRKSVGSDTFADLTNDYLPWYDQAGQFPKFADTARDYLLLAKNQPGGKFTWEAETWLVQVLSDTHNDDEIANNDQYKVAPLVGWKWGYEIVYKDQGAIGVDEPDDFTVNPLPFEWTTTPSDTWKKAISTDTKYGSKDKQDYWNITLGDCTGCDTPEPTSASCLAMGFVGLLVPRLRRRSLPRGAGRCAAR
jgi:hypothetical protein